MGIIGLPISIVGPGGSPSYREKVKGIGPANLIAYWPLDETSGTNADNAEGTAALDGTYSAVALNSEVFYNNDPVGLWDGTNDHCDIYSAGLNTAFNGQEGSLSLWLKVSAAGVWTDVTVRRIFALEVNSVNRIYLLRTTTNNQLRATYKAGNVTKQIDYTISDTGWIHVLITWSKTADKFILYVGGTQRGATVTGLGTWAGSLASTLCCIGATSTVPANVWDGYIAHVVLWDAPLTAGQAADLSVVPGGDIRNLPQDVANSSQYIIGIPQNNGAFYDGSRYWIFVTGATTLQCYYGTSLASLAQTGGNLVLSVNNSGRAYSILFAQVGGVWYAFALVSRDDTTAAEGCNVYRWELTSSGLGTVSNHISNLTDRNVVFCRLAHDYGSAEASRIYLAAGGTGDFHFRAMDPDLTDDTDMNGWNPANITLPEQTPLLSLSDGFYAMANNQGENPQNDTIGAYEIVKATEGGAWGAESAELGFTDQKYATNTSHAGQQDLCQLDDGGIYFAYIDDTDAAGDFGVVVLKKRVGTQAGAWSTVAADVLGSAGNAWAVALATDGTNVWIFYVKDDGGSRAKAIHYKKYDVAGDALSDELLLAGMASDCTFERMFTQWRATAGRITVAWSELLGVKYYVKAKAIYV